MAEYHTKKKGISFQGIIWKTLESLKEKSSNEYRTPEKKMIIHSNWTESVLEGNSRKESIQLIEFLIDILYQEFDKGTINKYDKIIEEINAQKNLSNAGKLDLDDYIIFKLEKMREILRLIMHRIKDRDYLKGLGDTAEEEEQ